MKRLYSVFMLGVAVSASAQNTGNQPISDLSSYVSLMSPNQQIIERVVNSGVFVVKQSYELADSLDKRFGWGGNKAFATDYTLAVRIKDGFVISDRTIHPWDYNLRFDKYRGKYTPKLFPSTFSEVASEAQYDTIMIIEDSLKTLSSGHFYAQESSLFFGDGFSVGGEYGENEGWIVWFTKKAGANLDQSTELKQSIVSKRLSIPQLKEGDSYFCPTDSLQTRDEIIGGIFVIPEVMSVGRMELKLCGILYRMENGWMLCCPFINTKEVFSHPKGGADVTSTEASSVNTTTLGLTPNTKEDGSDVVKKSKSKKRTKK